MSYTVHATNANGKLVVLTARVKPAWSVHTYIHTYIHTYVPVRHINHP